MPERAILLGSSRQLAAYRYLCPLIEGRRVLEIGWGAGEGTRYLEALGAREVVGVRAEAVGGALGAQAGLSFDTVIVPDAADLIRTGGPAGLAEVRRAAGQRSSVVCIAINSDRVPGSG